VKINGYTMIACSSPSPPTPLPQGERGEEMYMPSRGRGEEKCIRLFKGVGRGNVYAYSRAWEEEMYTPIEARQGQLRVKSPKFFTKTILNIDKIKYNESLLAKFINKYSNGLLPTFIN